MKKFVVCLVITLLMFSSCSVPASANSTMQIVERHETIEFSSEATEIIPDFDNDKSESTESSDTSSETLNSNLITNKNEPTISLSKDTFKAGDMITVTIKNINKDTNLDISTTLDCEPHFFFDGKNATSMIAAKISTRPSIYNIMVCIDGKENRFPIEVVDANFETETFKVDNSVANDTVNNNNATIEYTDATAEHKASCDEEFYATDGFMMPIVQETFRISSSFGYTRIINGVASRHGGVDFPAPAGTPVVATGNGKVLFAQLLQLTGNTVIIEHGNGLKSWYYHMSAIDCTPGQMIKKGEPVGKVGTTGFSTGNHLHFAMSVNDVYTNPWQFIKKPKK